MKLDTSVLKDIEWYIVYGFDPGSYTCALLENDANSYLYAHPLYLKNDMEVHKNHVSVIDKYIPQERRISRSDNWKGLSNMTKAEVDEFIFSLILKNCPFTKMLLETYADDIKTSGSFKQ